MYLELYWPFPSHLIIVSVFLWLHLQCLLYCLEFMSTKHRSLHDLEQESPPAWTQKAYCLPCSEYSFCPGRGGYLTRYPPRGWGGLGTPPWGGPSPGGSGYPLLLHGILGNVAKHYGIWVPPCGQTDGWMEGQTLVKTLPSLVLRTRAVIRPKNRKLFRKRKKKKKFV